MSFTQVNQILDSEMNELTKADMKIAVIGCGYWGKNLVRKFVELDVLAAISDPDPEVVGRLTKAHNVSAMSVEQILADKTINAVAIAAPAEKHHELTIRSFAVGKHVFVEKPIALTIDNAHEMCAAADKADKILMVGHLLQYHPAFLKLKKIVHGGELGKLRYIYSRRLNIGKLRTHENVLWSFAPHDISMILALVGSEPDKITGFAGNFLQDSISDFANIQMEFPDGVKAHIETSWLNPFKEQRLVVVGENAMLEFNDQADWSEKLKIYRHKAEIINGHPVVEPAEAAVIKVEPFEPLLNECKFFLRFIKNNETPFTDGREAISVLRVLRAGDVSISG